MFILKSPVVKIKFLMLFICLYGACRLELLRQNVQFCWTSMRMFFFIFFIIIIINNHMKYKEQNKHQRRQKERETN